MINKNMINKTLTAVALATVLASPAFAQQAPKSTSAPMAQPDKAAKPDTMAKPDTKPDTAQSKPAAADKSAASASTTEKKAGFVQNQSAEEWRASKLIGTSVYGPDNKSIGEINDAIVDGTGNIKAVVVGVGGFLGVGEKNVAIPFDSLSVQRKANSSSIEKITVKFSKDELKNAPKFAYYEAPKSSTSSTTGSSTGMKPMKSTPMGGHTTSK